MDTELKCLRCGGSNLEPGIIQANGRVGFRPKRAKFITTKVADVSIRANICLNCGHMEFLGDAKKTKLLVKAPPQHASCPASV